MELFSIKTPPFFRQNHATAAGDSHPFEDRTKLEHAA
jgi:hypothetical protein